MQNRVVRIHLDTILKSFADIKAKHRVDFRVISCCGSVHSTVSDVESIFKVNVEIRSAEGSPGKTQRYEVTNQQKSSPARSMVYRLLQYDKGSSDPILYRTSCMNPGLQKPEVWVSNPMEKWLRVQELSPNTMLILIDASGKIWLNSTNDAPDFEHPVPGLPKGKYWLQANSELEQKTVPLFKVW